MKKLVAPLLVSCLIPFLTSKLSAQEAAVSADAAQSSASAQLPPEIANFTIGTNLSGVADWQPELPFNNLVKSMRVWNSRTAGSKDFSDKRPLDLDEQGNVRSLAEDQVAFSLAFVGLDPDRTMEGYPQGEMLFLYDGEGTFSWKGKAVLVESGQGYAIVRVDPSKTGLFEMELTSANPDNYPKNLRLWRPDTWQRGGDGGFVEPEEIFSAVFLDFYRPFTALRFMDWLKTNNSKQVNWNDRAKPDMTFYTTSAGVPHELIIALANKLKVIPWVCVPERATDEYVRSMAQLYRDTLDTSLRPMVEYGNEAWNTMFSFGKFAAEQAAERGLGEKSNYGAQLDFYAVRALEIFKIWNEVFAENGRAPINVLAAQAANSWTTRRILKNSEAAEHAHVLAIAPYFSLNVSKDADAQAAIAGGLDGIFSRLEAESLPKAAENMSETAASLAGTPLRMVAYEGGQHLNAVGNQTKNKELVALLNAANRDPRMEALYIKYLQAWKDAGGAHFSNFSSTSLYNQHGSWGLKEYIEQPEETAPKYLGVKHWLKELGQLSGE